MCAVTDVVLGVWNSAWQVSYTEKASPFCSLSVTDTTLGVFCFLRYLWKWKSQLLPPCMLPVSFDCSTQHLFLGLFPRSWTNYFTEFYNEFPLPSAGLINLMIHVLWKQIALFLIICTASDFTIIYSVDWELGSSSWLLLRAATAQL